MIRSLSCLVLLAVFVVPLWASAAPTTEFDVQTATEAYLDTLSPEEKQRSDAYFEGGYWLQLWSFIYGALVYLGLLHTGASAKMRALAERVTRNKSLRVWLYFAIFVFVTTLATFPLSLYSGFFREHQYGLSNQSFSEWMADQLKGLVLGIILGGLAVMAIYKVIRRTRRQWWIWSAGVGLAFIIIGFTLAPVYIAPMFNTYTKLEDGPVKAAVLRMARANGIGVDDIYKSDASRQSTRISANVSGMLGTERITLNDNLLERCSQEEIEAVMGHEIGHYVLNHSYKGIMFFSIVLVGGFGFVAWGFHRLHRRYGKRWGIRDEADPAGLPLFAVLFSTYMFALTPVTNSYIRAGEQEADVFGLNAARQPDGFAEVAIKLSEYRKLEPGPVEEFVFFDHPSGRTRVETAMQWKAAQRESGAEGATPDQQ